MRNRFETIGDARACIERNGGIVGVKALWHPRPGLKVLSSMDYLINHCGYRKDESLAETKKEKEE